jgi:hypothetical protein
LPRGIYRCSDGHLFRRTVLAMLFEANLGPKRHLEKCPVDGKLRVIKRVSKDELTEAQLAEVEANSRK